MNGNNLQITVSAVDEASGDIADIASNVSESMSELASSFSDASTSAQESIDSLNEVMSVDSSQISDSAIAAGTSFDDAAAQITGAAESADDSVGTSSSSMRSNFIQLGIVAGSVFAPLADLIKTAASNSEDWNETSATIAQTLQDTGSSIPINEVQQYAAQVQGLTLFTQQDVLQSEELILSHKDLQGSFQQLTMLAADAADKMGIDLPSATKILTNALADPAAGITQLIRQLNIDLPASTVTTIENLAKFGDTAQADQMILSALQGQIGGVAQAADNASGTGFTKLYNSLIQLTTYIGSTLNPIFDAVAAKLQPIVQWIDTWVQEHPKLTAGILLTVTALAGLLVLLAAFGVLMITAGIALTALADPITWVIGAFVLVGAGLTALAVLWKQVLNELATVATAIWATIVDTFKTSVDLLIGDINMFIGALDDIKINIPSVKIGSLSTPALDIGFNIPKIPMLAAGGVVTSTTLAILGESGPEAVVPLSSYAGGQQSIGGAAGGQGSIVININGPISDANTARNYANQIAKSINAQLKLKNFN